MNKPQLTNSLQNACLTRLVSWRKHRKYALYRRTEDFVQWLVFDTSEFSVAARPHYSIQALATQFPAESLTLGDMVRDKRGLESWITPDEWKTQHDEIVDRIIVEINPPALEPFTVDAVLEFLNHFKSDHVSAITAYGIAMIITGNIEDGYYRLRQALAQYKNIPSPWARVEEAHLNGWLSCGPEDIVSVLRQQAATGAQLLRLK